MEALSNYGGLLRNRLKEKDPSLYQVLEKCWQIAVSEWLPAIKHDQGSLNSYPHMRNVERYLDMIIGAYESYPESRMVPLSPAETYLLLSSALFHDVGRAYAGDHEKVGYHRIPERFANYGIPSYEFARTIATICLYHEKPVSARAALTTTVIDPYGEIRERFLAALLTLADMMDNAYSRVLPPYCFSDIDAIGKGLMRRFIRGVYIDPEAQMVRTVLVMQNTTPRGYAQEHGLHFKIALATSKGGKDPTRQTRNRLKQLGIPDTEIPVEKRRQLQGVEECLRERVKQEEKWADVSDGLPLLFDEALGTTPVLSQLLAKGLLRVQKPTHKDNVISDTIALSRHALSAIVFPSISDNCEKLDLIRDDLAASGVFVSTFVVEKGEHLYNHRLEETYEPIFDPSYLESVVDGMWELSTQIFGESRFTYIDLASHIGEPDVDRVKRAVRRIALAAQSHMEETSDRMQNPITAALSYWVWNVGGGGKDLAFHNSTTIKHVVKRLCKPFYDDRNWPLYSLPGASS